MKISGNILNSLSIRLKTSKSGKSLKRLQANDDTLFIFWFDFLPPAPNFTIYQLIQMLKNKNWLNENLYLWLLQSYFSLGLASNPTSLCSSVKLSPTIAIYSSYLVYAKFLSPILLMLSNIKSNGSIFYLFFAIKVYYQFCTFFIMYLATPKLSPLHAECNVVFPFLSFIPNFKFVFFIRKETV